MTLRHADRSPGCFADFLKEQCWQYTLLLITAVGLITRELELASVPDLDANPISEVQRDRHLQYRQSRPYQTKCEQTSASGPIKQQWFWRRLTRSAILVSFAFVHAISIIVI